LDDTYNGGEADSNDDGCLSLQRQPQRAYGCS